MRFNVVTPTYNRPDLLAKAIASVKDQTYGDWRLVVVNDSPENPEYGMIEEKNSDDPRIIFLKNEKNMGVNFSRNRALDFIGQKGAPEDWVVFLDDDDVLAKDALEEFSKIHSDFPADKWILTNRANRAGISFTRVPRSDSRYHYILGFLLTKRLKGDATHCINVEVIKNIRFSKLVKQGEEWIFFYELALQVKKFFYRDYHGTISDGYGDDGLNFRRRTRKQKMNDLRLLMKESCSRGIIWRPTLIFYFLARLIRAIFLC